MFSTIIVTTNLEPNGDRALPVAAALGSLAGVDVDVVKVAPRFLSTEVDAGELARRVASALRPGGWLLWVALKPEGEPLSVAVGRLRTAAWGGSLVTPEQVESLLKRSGLVDAHRLPSTAAGLTCIVAARRAQGP
jgi:hypothetical protein